MWLFNHTISQQKKAWQRKLPCPYMMCPSNQPFEGAYKSRMKFIQKIAPTVNQYKCKHCSCVINVSIEVETIAEKTAQHKTPSLMGFRQ